MGDVPRLAPVIIPVIIMRLIRFDLALKWCS
jgi:hypothetical protein